MADSFLKSLLKGFFNGRPKFTLNNGMFGYDDGGTVTQATGKTTAFTLDKVTGRIILASSALAAWVSSSATWTNSYIGSYDTIQWNQDSGTLGAYQITFVTSNGQAQVVVWNNSSTALTEAVAFRFTILKGSQA